MLQHECPLGRAARPRGRWVHDRRDRDWEGPAAVLLCLDAAGTARDLAAGALACPSCGTGRLAPWGHGTERVIRLRNGRTARLRPGRARCRSCRRPHVLLPAWCAPRRADGIEVIGAAAGLAMAGHGHRPVAAALGVPPGTARGWLRRLRARAEPLRQHAPASWASSATTRPGRPASRRVAAGRRAERGRRRRGLRQAQLRGPAGDDLGPGLALGLARFLTPAPAG